ncbi:MAG: rod shape-determining protein MreC [Firmicutes bacterium]|nr:rod shape-determining protein MreC [Bacillota bacterium]
MPRNKRPLYSSLRDLVRVSLRDLKPIQIEQKPNTVRMSVCTRIFLIVLACIGLILTTFLVGNYLAPAGSFLNRVASPIQRGFSAIGNAFSKASERNRSVDELTNENAVLRQQLEALQYENTVQKVQLEKLAELSELYELDLSYADYPKTGAEIISVSPGNWMDSIMINKGSSEGMKDYYPVLTGGGLLGCIRTVSYHSSEIMTLLSSDSYIYGEILRSGDRVGVTGSESLQQENLCQIEFVMDKVDIAVGDEIVTSSLSTVYPPGIRIGMITEIREKGDGVNGIAYLEPYARIRDASTVLIITDDLPAEEDSAP